MSNKLKVSKCCINCNDKGNCAFADCKCHPEYESRYMYGQTSGNPVQFSAPTPKSKERKIKGWVHTLRGGEHKLRGVYLTRKEAEKDCPISEGNDDCIFPCTITYQLK